MVKPAWEEFFASGKTEEEVHTERGTNGLRAEKLVMQALEIHEYREMDYFIEQLVEQTVCKLAWEKVLANVRMNKFEVEEVVRLTSEEFHMERGTCLLRAEELAGQRDREISNLNVEELVAQTGEIHED